MAISDIMAATERRDRNATKSLLHKMKTAGEVISKKGRYSLPPIHAVNSVDRVDGEATAVNQGPYNSTVSGMANGQRSGQRPVNGRRGADQALTGTKTDKPLNPDNDSDSGQQVNAVNGLEHSKAADDGLDIPDFLPRRPAHSGRPATGWMTSGDAPHKQKSE